MTWIMTPVLQSKGQSKILVIVADGAVGGDFTLILISQSP